MNLIYFAIIINLLAFVIMFYDKHQAEKNKRRISERTLLLLAFFFGGPGIYLGMYVFRHKTQKNIFKYGIPLLIIWDIWLFWKCCIHYIFCK
jgi:uncharacterized membrane protein YsdA (DUF1294 family)